LLLASGIIIDSVDPDGDEFIEGLAINSGDRTLGIVGSNSLDLSHGPPSASPGSARRHRGFKPPANSLSGLKPTGKFVEK